jgi:hypothetical protein
MIKSYIELANHICNEVPGLDFDMVLERLKKKKIHETEADISPEEVISIVEEFRTYYAGELDY